MENIGLDSDQNYDNIKACEIYPKKEILKDDPNLKVPFAALPGEGVEHIGCTTEGIIVLSNYRFYHHTKDAVFNIPLGRIEQIECRDIFFLHIFCKDAQSFRCTFTTNEDSLKWHRRLMSHLVPPNKVEEFFGFAFYMWCREERKDLFERLRSSYQKDDETDSWCIEAEAERMRFDLKCVWRITLINKNYTLCPSYPEYFLVPASIPDTDLELVANFRYSHRIPAVVWRHQTNGAVIARSSQPEVGWFAWRNHYDENLIQAIADACNSDSGTSSTQEECFSMGSEIDSSNVSLPSQLSVDSSEGKSNKKLLILDARSYTAAVANRAKGGGCEFPEYYPNCEIQFMSLANIHSIRKSFQSLRALCASPQDQNWLSLLEGTKWLQYIAGLLKAALVVVHAIDIEQRPVLVHCSDGWDRTPQIVALAELMLDPYYRTMEGFQVLVEREWLSFGHKFGDRCGHSPGNVDPNERCPVFLQWLDCVHQLLWQFPCSFEFNEQYLVKLVHHTYSCLFGTFYCNNSQERNYHRIHGRTFSIWNYLHSFPERFNNYLYQSKDQVLHPSCQMKDILFWSNVYHPPMFTPMMCLNKEQQDVKCCNGDLLQKNECQLVKTKSYDNILTIDHMSVPQRRNSDPNIAEKHVLPKTSNVAKQLKPQKLLVKEDNTVVSQPIYSNEKSANGENSPLLTVNNEQCEKDDLVSTVSQGDLSTETTDLSNLSIDGSTDTLVSENGISIHESPKTELAIENGIKEVRESFDNLKSFVNNSNTDEVMTVKTLKQGNSISTSTTDISDSCVMPMVTECYPPLQCLMTDCLHPSQSTWTAWFQNKLGNEAVPPVLSKQPLAHSSNMGGRTSQYSTPHHSRTPSSGFPATPCDEYSYDISTVRCNLVPSHLLDIDGVMVMKNEVQERLQQIFNNHQSQIEALRRDLYVKQLELKQKSCLRCHGRDEHSQECSDDTSLADSACSGEQQSNGQDSSAASDVSWELVDERETHTTLWVPNHAVSYCMGCDAKFWIGRRKHHCRNCGHIFCGQCSNQAMPIPNEHLDQPVRVCSTCYNSLQFRCRQQIVSCEKMPKPVVSAASN